MFKNIKMNKLIFLLGSFALFVPEGAIAGGFDAITASVGDSVSTLPRLVSVCAYIAGSVFIVAGMLRLKDHGESPSNRPLKNALGMLLIGSMLVALPKTVDLVMGSINGDAVVTPIDSNAALSDLQNRIGGR